LAKIRDLWNERGYLIEHAKGSEIRINADIKGQDPDPKKRTEMQAHAMNGECPTCGRIIGDHTPEEIRACSRKWREQTLV
jgi:NMD protein affecting ribosome stability and mRNA decay